ncbi:MAG TPA: ChaN family lipoprotein [Candidatus Polarisedimenticolia bacterium]|nr:ChaN family lipoprotein [Candidatus Polarisedimenticolia bacterium]
MAFQRQVVARLKREIFGVDPNSARKYIQEFHQDFEQFREISSYDDLLRACVHSDIVFIGDYHALPSCQAFEARLLSEIASRGRTILCLEMIYGRQQRILDRFMSGEISEDEFLRRIRYDLEWGYDWQGFRPLFQAARDGSVPVYGIDCEPRSGFRHIRKRDAYAAARIATVAEKNPGARLLVIVGESHLGRKHLPGRVRHALRRRHRTASMLTVVQNLENLYWQLAEQGQPGRDVVQVADDAYCVFNASPLEKYESYRQVLDRWKGEQEDDSDVDLTPTVYNIIDTILDFLRIDKYTHCLRKDSGRCSEYLVDAYPEVYGTLEEAVFRKILRSAHLGSDESEAILAHVQKKGSCFVPRLNAIFLGQFDLAHGGEEAAHFVNLALKRELYEEAPARLPAHDLFYGRVVEEALAFFGSKLIVPGRNHFFETEFYQYYRKDPEVVEAKTPYSYEEFREIIDFILLHKKFETRYGEYEEVPGELLRGIRSGPKRSNVLVHELGYFLGQQIYDGYHAGAITRKEISDLFRKKMVESGSALRTYLDLVEKLSGVPA